MKKYEGMFIFGANVAAENKPEKLIEGWVKGEGGSVSKIEDRGNQRLGYAIKKCREGKVFVAQFQLDPAKVQPLRHTLELNETLLKYTIVVPSERKIVYQPPRQEEKSETPQEVL